MIYKVTCRKQVDVSFYIPVSSDLYMVAWSEMIGFMLLLLHDEGESWNSIVDDGLPPGSIENGRTMDGNRWR